MCVLQVSCCSPFGAFAPRLRGTRCEIIQNNSCVQVFYTFLFLNVKELSLFVVSSVSLVVLRTESDRIAYAARSVSVRRPIGLRPLHDDFSLGIGGKPLTTYRVNPTL